MSSYLEETQGGEAVHTLDLLYSLFFFPLPPNFCRRRAGLAARHAGQAPPAAKLRRLRPCVGAKWLCSAVRWMLDAYT